MGFQHWLHISVPILVLSAGLVAATSGDNTGVADRDAPATASSGSCTASGPALIQERRRLEKNQGLQQDADSVIATTTPMLIFPVNESNFTTTEYNASADHDCVQLDWSDWGDCILPPDGSSLSRYQMRFRDTLQNATGNGAACNESEQIRYCEYDGFGGALGSTTVAP
mmetsp:Transcript_25346/g.58927  ORF Transcript_25346/g.58927 Transcript_25346/m.58927 type:complete len:169 (+) Transcript_25346:93-599(+)|eukprot:CAMPEP_0178388228 /NCGR_PEP_ID=MMETSP0689_2-20121128/9480_1 /TAXON_ID=160604 /ORGANISM="Amphidinium massartii, Strain CS-259" /LENGTH=168 /DNA_ID=CAMNT_0020008615 /DNA_START=73 /DNA_END=579 /DNA_ORIENTATION=+